jgi:hypothetical protein
MREWQEAIIGLVCKVAIVIDGGRCMRADLMDNCIIGKQIADDFYKQLSADI